MTNVESARASMARAQGLLEQVTADLQRLEETAQWLEEARKRVHELNDYYREQGEQDVAAILAEQPEEITAPVGNEDAVWDAVVSFDEHMLRLLRIVTEEITATLDDEQPGCCTL